MFKIQILSKFNAVINIESKKYFVEDGKDLILQTDLMNNLNLEVFPKNPVVENKRLLPFVVCLQNDMGKLSTNSSLADLVKFDLENYQLILKEYCVHLQKNVAHEFNNGTIADVSLNGELILKVNNEAAFKKLFNTSIETTNFIELKNNFFAVLVLKENNEGVVFVFDADNKLVLEKSANKIEITDDGFQILQIFNDVTKNGLVNKYKINETLEMMEEYAVYLKDGPKEINNKRIVPIAFLQCIKAKNFEYAKTFLSLDLEQKVTEDNLSAYFGEWNEICTNYLNKNTFNQFALIYGEENKFAKIFNFKIENDLITNIEQLQI